VGSSHAVAATAALRSTVITPGSVAGILATFSVENNRANSSLSVADQSKDEQGSAQTIDNAFLTIDRLAGYKAVTGAKFYGTTSVPIVSTVPRQSGYPAEFAAVIKFVDARSTPEKVQTCAGGNVLDVFEKNSAGASWRLADEPYVSPGLLKQFPTGPGGYAVPVNEAKLGIPVADVPNELVAALNTYAVNGSLINGLTKADFSFGHGCWAIDDIQADIAQSAKSQVTDAYSVTAYTPSDVSAFSLSAGAAVVVFSVTITEVQTGTGGGTLTETNKTGDPGSYLEPAGTFTTITSPEVCELAAIDPAKSAGAHPVPRVVGAYCGFLVGSAH
jgi:hypothetical protein